jgi:hypothetical protein
MECNSSKEMPMRTRAVVLVVAILLIAGFAALNWSEIVRPTPLSFGLFVTDAPLGGLLLALLALAVVVFALSGAAMRTQSLMESRQHYKTLEAQRELADKAEASRFTDLRQHLDMHLRELRERDAVAVGELQKSVVQSQRELRTHLEQINRTLAARLNELEARLDQRLAAAGGRFGGPVAATPAGAVAGASAAAEAARAEQAERDAIRQERAVEDAREVRNVVPREERTVPERPAESGWRRWF